MRELIVFLEDWRKIRAELPMGSPTPWAVALADLCQQTDAHDLRNQLAIVIVLRDAIVKELKRKNQ